MKQNFNQDLKKLQPLIDLFLNNIDAYKSGKYNEANTRTNFIDPFFELLGWDMRNKQGYAEMYRDVIVEDSIKIEGKPKAPDYSFRVGGQRKFFVEAKKPSVYIKEDIGPAYQVRRYAYTAKLPLSILTDFEEFAVYDTRIKPRPKDSASVGRIFYCTYKEYKENFDFIYNTFSKEAILKGSFDKYIQDNKRRGTSEVDKEFLKLIETWRINLAKNIAINNKKLDIYHLNRSVQKIIDRIIFLRIVEDRNIEKYGKLIEIVKQKGIYKSFNDYIKIADKKYNSGLFDYRGWIADLKIDDKIFKDIVNTMYYPQCPYEFSVLPVEILGNIYEQFLGKVITLTESHHAKIEEKPEVRKAGGVYYTPQYIVNYIVKNTVGQKLKNKSTKPQNVENITILDPACGSGSFLLGAYDYLLNWHLEYYIQEKRIKKAIRENKIYQAGENNYRLTIQEKRKILLNNIYGVDIDEQAVEVTKLSLLIKLLEDEKQESAGRLFSKYNQGALLPNLSSNIKCGNSLIGPDFYEGQNLNLFDNEQMKKINAFDWKKHFEEIFDKGGFDVVIGNPPYIDSEEMVRSSKEIRDYCSKNYETTKGNWDMYCVFSEKGIDLLREKGIFGFIIPNKFISLPYGDYLKKYFSKYQIKNIADYSCVDVFVTNNKKVNVYPIVIIVQKNTNKILGQYNQMVQDGGLIKLKYKKNFTIKLGDINWAKNFDPLETIIDKVTNKSKGISEIFIVENAATVAEAYEIKKIILDRNVKKGNFFKFVNTGTIDRYHVLWGKVNTNYIKDKYIKPIVLVSDLKKGFQSRFGQAESEKLILAGMVKNLEVVYDRGKILAGKSTIIIRYGDESEYKLKFLLGLLNSTLFSVLFRAINRYSSMSGGYISLNKNKIQNFYFPNINLSKPTDKVLYNNLTNLVDQMLEAQNKYRKVKSDSDKKIYKQRIDILDSQIDKLVYELYDLTDEEIKIVEGEVK